jgi:hypothetical protein
MDVISLGKAMKAKRAIKQLQNRLGMNGTEQGNDVRDIHANVKARLEALEAKNPGITLYNRVSEVEANTAINLNKHNLHINSVLNKDKYGLTDLAFDDFGDDSGIDHSKSTGHQFDSAGRKVKIASGQTQAEVVTTAEETNVVPRMITVSQAFNEVLTGERQVDLTNGNFINTSYNENKIMLNVVGQTIKNGILLPDNMIVTASASYNSSATPDKIFDGNLYTNWVAPPGSNHWLMIDLGTEYEITKIRIANNNDSDVVYGKQYSVSGSKDNVTWNLIKTITGLSDMNGNFIDIQLDSPASYRYIKFHNMSTSHSNFGAKISEVQIIGNFACPIYESLGTYESPVLDLGDNFKDIVKIDQVINLPSVYTGDVVPTMTGFTTNGVTISSSGRYDANYYEWKAFNDSLTDVYDAWITRSGYTIGEWISVDFGAGNEKTIVKYAIQGRNYTYTYCPAGWVLEASNDNTNWTILDTRSNEPQFAGGEKREYLVSNSNSYRYYRIRITEKPVDNPNYAAFGEIDLMEKKSSSPDLILYTATSADGINFSDWQPVNPDGTITSPSARYIKVKVELTGGGEIQEKLIYDFTNTESANFQNNDKVILDGSLKLKTLYTNTMVHDTAWSEAGNLFKQIIDKSSFKAIEKIQVI